MTSSGRARPATRKGNTVYLHLLQPEVIGGTLTLPALPRRVLSAHVLGGKPVDVTQDKWSLTLDIDGRTLPPIETVVTLQLDGSAMSLAPVPAARPSQTKQTR